LILHTYIGIFEIKNEDYSEVEESLKEILGMIKNLHSIDLMLPTGNRTVTVKKYLCADFKMLSILYGLANSNANHACIFCQQNLSDDVFDQEYLPDDSDLTNELYTPREISRSLSEAVAIVNSGEKNNNGYLRIPLISIDFQNCVFDKLHFFLRGLDKLMEILINLVNDQDSNRGRELDRRPRLKKFFDFLKDDCKISNAFYYSTKKYKSNQSDDNISLNSNDLEKIFLNLYPVDSESKLFTQFLVIDGDQEDYKIKLNQINAIWKCFYQIYLVAKNKR